MTIDSLNSHIYSQKRISAGLESFSDTSSSKLQTATNSDHQPSHRKTRSVIYDHNSHLINHTAFAIDEGRLEHKQLQLLQEINNEKFDNLKEKVNLTALLSH